MQTDQLSTPLALLDGKALELIALKPVLTRDQSQEQQLQVLRLKVREHIIWKSESFWRARLAMIANEG